MRFSAVQIVGAVVVSLGLLSLKVEVSCPGSSYWFVMYIIIRR